MLFCQLGGAKSLREICGGLAASEGKLRHLGLPEAPPRSTLVYANEQIAWPPSLDTGSIPGASPRTAVRRVDDRFVLCSKTARALKMKGGDPGVVAIRSRTPGESQPAPRPVADLLGKLSITEFAVLAEKEGPLLSSQRWGPR